jgi:hypothetical protein
MTSRLEITYEFYNYETTLWKGGPLAFFRMARIACRRKLEAAGGFGPFKLKIRRSDGRVSPHTLVMWEAY